MLSSFDAMAAYHVAKKKENQRISGKWQLQISDTRDSFL